MGTIPQRGGRHTSKRLAHNPLIVSCQRHGKDPLAFVKDIRTPLPSLTNQDDLRQLTPQRKQAAPPAN